ncbi:MAG: type II/IV secretion system ATPase subunit [DPANN group archaeon]|nr:type II/IV secretion system ATPase subunit [DPANN group archaeon]
MAHKYTIKSEGGKRYLFFDYRGSPFTPSIADVPETMAEVIEVLKRTDADLIVLADVYERVYDEEQAEMLKQISDLSQTFEKEGVWTYSALGGDKAECQQFLQQRYNTISTIGRTQLLQDPIQAYMNLINVIRQEKSQAATMASEFKYCSDVYLNTLNFMLQEFETTKLIQKFKFILKKLGKLPPGRDIYRSIFETQIKPSFISSRVFFATPENIELIDQYNVLDATINIYKHPEKIQYLYYVDPPEYNLSPEKYFLLTKTKELVASFHPEGLRFMSPTEVKEYFISAYESTIADLAKKNSIKITGKEIEELARIVARYTVGYGMMELLLSDRRLTDVYMDAPLGLKPVYIVHSDYGSCQSNVVFTESEAKSVISRFRSQSGRPFDEAHPVLDFDMPDLQTRVAVIGPPLSPDGTAFALRLHKETPWTLPQFIDVKMMDSLTAGMLSFFIDAQASTLVNGSRGSGKSSLMMALMLEILPSLRIIVQEDTMEIPVPYMRSLGYNIQRLKTQSAISVSRTAAEVSPEDALRTALRLGDSVLIVGEVRSQEAKVLYEAMRVGAVGNVVMGTIHGENAYSVWDRIVNDLGVENTSFKATDIVVTCAPVRFGGSLRRHRRLIEITEIGKKWYDDPEKEGGLVDLITFDTATDKHILMEKNLERSEMFPRMAKKRGLTVDQLWQDIQARAETKNYLVEKKREHDIPDLLEGAYTVPANDKWLLLLEQQREVHGSVDYDEAVRDWKKWVDENQVTELLSRRTPGA